MTGPVRDLEGKTKIVATLGPACRDARVMLEMVRAGMDMARINASHADPESIRAEVEGVRRASREAEKEVGVILDLMGPKLRIGEIEGGSLLLEAGDTLRLVENGEPGGAGRVSVDLPGMGELLRPGDTVLLDDGCIRLVVEESVPGEVRCRVVNGGILSSRKGMNLPGVRLDLPSLTDKDLRDLRTGLDMGVDWVALSFVRSAKDVEELRLVLREWGSDLPIVAKIEKQEAVEELEAVVEVADAVMVARGDLGVEMPLEEIPLLQKRIVGVASRHGKPVIIATQMLQSMMEKPSPTRAEVTDVANAVFDGADAVMLSGETAVGNHPVEAVETMRRIVRKAEAFLPYPAWLEERRRWVSPGRTVEAVCMAACELALQVEAKAIVAPTESGFTARQMSRFRPRQPVLAPTPSLRVARMLNLYWGVHPVQVGVHDSIEETFSVARKVAGEVGLLAEGETVVITAGLKSSGEEGIPTTNTIHCITG